MSKKVVLKLDLHDDKEKKRALKTVSGITGIESIAMNMKDKKLTVTGDMDPVKVVSKLRNKNWYVEVLTVGPAKEEKKKEEPKKEEGKKDDKKEAERIAELLRAWPNYNPYINACYCVPIVEDYRPTGCVIC